MNWEQRLLWGRVGSWSHIHQGMVGLVGADESAAGGCTVQGWAGQRITIAWSGPVAAKTAAVSTIPAQLPNWCLWLVSCSPTPGYID